MNVNSVYGSTATAATASAAGVAATSPTSSSEAAGAPTDAASASLSTAGQFFHGMQQLAAQDPMEFKAVAAQVATNFQNAASQTSGTQAQVLTKLASTFTEAAQTGAMPPPPQGQPGEAMPGGRHHHHGSHAAITQAFQGALGILNQATGAG